MTIRRDPLDPNERELVREGAPSPAGPRRSYMPEIPEGAQLTQEVVRFHGGSRVPGLHDATDLAKDPAGVPDPAQVEVPAALRAEIEDFMSRYPDHRSAAIPALAAAQRVHGWCSPQAIEQVACVMRLTPAYLTAVVGFYDMLEGTEVGRQTVYVCTNISCSLRGADDLLAALQAQIGDHPDVNVRGFECLGACDIAPMCSVNGTYVGPIDADEIPELAQQILTAQDPLPGKQLVRRRVADVAANSDDVARASVDSGTLDPVSLDGGRSA